MFMRAKSVGHGPMKSSGRRTVASASNGNGNGSNHFLADDDFSKELQGQGDDGLFLRTLYLKPWPLIYSQRVNDQSIRVD